MIIIRKREEDFAKLKQGLRRHYDVYDDYEEDMLAGYLYKRIPPSMMNDLKLGEDPIKFFSKNEARIKAAWYDFDGEVVIEYENSLSNDTGDLGNNPWKTVQDSLPITSNDAILKNAIKNVLKRKENEYVLAKQSKEQSDYVKELYGITESKRKDDFIEDFIKLNDLIGVIEDRMDFIDYRFKQIRKTFGPVLARIEKYNGQ